MFRPGTSVRRISRRPQPNSRPVAMWKHKFVCLASSNAVSVPSSKGQKDGLAASGLGEKVIEIEITASSEDLHQVICQHFPPLVSCGGYQLCKCIPNSKALEVISSPPSGHTPVSIAECIGQSKVYVRPLQSDICLAGKSSEVSALVINC